MAQINTFNACSYDNTVIKHLHSVNIVMRRPFISRAVKNCLTPCRNLARSGLTAKLPTQYWFTVDSLIETKNIENTRT